MKAKQRLQEKKESVHRSIPLVTSYLHGLLSSYENDSIYTDLYQELMDEIATNEYELDQRTLQSIVVLLYCSKKVFLIYRVAQNSLLRRKKLQTLRYQTNLT